MTGPRFLGLRGTITLRIIGACPEEFLMRLKEWLNIWEKEGYKLTQNRY